mgnify:CR=1 FL=1
MLNLNGMRDIYLDKPVLKNLRWLFQVTILNTNRYIILKGIYIADGLANMSINSSLHNILIDDVTKLGRKWPQPTIPLLFVKTLQNILTRSGTWTVKLIRKLALILQTVFTIFSVKLLSFLWERSADTSTSDPIL